MFQGAPGYFKGVLKRVSGRSMGARRISEGSKGFHGVLSGVQGGLRDSFVHLRGFQSFQANFQVILEVF